MERQFSMIDGLAKIKGERISHGEKLIKGEKRETDSFLVEGSGEGVSGTSGKVAFHLCAPHPDFRVQNTPSSLWVVKLCGGRGGGGGRPVARGGHGHVFQ